MKLRIISGQTYVLNPITKVWDAPGGTPYPPDELVVMLSSGRLALGEMVVATETVEGDLVYHLSGVPMDNKNVERVTLWINPDIYLVRQIDYATILSKADVPLALVPPGVTKLVQLAQYKFEPLPSAVTVIVPEHVATQPAPAPSSDTIPSPFGPMVLYEGKRIPISLQYPAVWIPPNIPSEAPSYPMVMRHAKTGSGQLTITEPSFEELGASEKTLDEYTETVIAANRLSLPDFKLISQDTINLPNEEKAKLIVFSFDNGQRVCHRLIYVYKNGYIFNMTYCYRPSLDDLKSLIDYSFDTLKVHKNG